MQYLLSEEEMAAVREERLAIAQKLPDRTIAGHLEGLTNVCRHVATTMIQTAPVNGGGVSYRPHGCIHVPDPRGPQWRTRYCDGCQVARICPQPKEYSK
jgi:hypothetical protein